MLSRCAAVILRCAAVIVLCRYPEPKSSPDSLGTETGARQPLHCYRKRCTCSNLLAALNLLCWLPKVGAGVLSVCCTPVIAMYTAWLLLHNSKDGSASYAHSLPRSTLVLCAVPADTNQNQLLCYHVLGNPQSEDVTVLADPDHPLWMFGAEVTDDGR
jgi:hypothetical protein